MKGKNGIELPNRSDGSMELEGFLKEVPDFRKDMVVRMRTKILKGIYDIEAELAVRGIMRHGLYVLNISQKDDSHPP